MSDSSEEVINGQTLLRLPLSPAHELLVARLHPLADPFLPGLN